MIYLQQKKEFQNYQMINGYHFLFMNIKIMRNRVQFLCERKEVGNDDYLKLYSAFQDNLNNSELLIMLVLKNSIKPINDINSKINNLTELIKIMTYNI